MVVTPEGGVLVLDAKINLDDHALFRHRDLAELRDFSKKIRWRSKRRSTI